MYASAIATVVLCVGSANASEGESTQQVNWNDAVNFAELSDTFINSDGILMATYYDAGQNVLWSQPASRPVESAADVFPFGAEYASALDSFQWIVPTSLWLCYEDTGTCTTGEKWSSGDFDLSGVDDNYARFVTVDNDCLYEDIERVRATGGSNLTDYCDAYYCGNYHDHSTNNWDNATSDWCGSFTTYYYGLDESSAVNGYEYDSSESSVPVAQFQFHVPGAIYFYSEIWLARCGY